MTDYLRRLESEVRDGAMLTNADARAVLTYVRGLETVAMETNDWCEMCGVNHVIKDLIDKGPKEPE